MMGAAAISALTQDVKTIYKTEDVDNFLPHRYPFAFIDKIVEFEAGKKAVGIKQVTKNEEFFNGHFPSMPVMPGVLQLEAMAQLAGCVMAGLEGAEPGAIFFFGGADGVKWKVSVLSIIDDHQGMQYFLGQRMLKASSPHTYYYLLLIETCRPW